MKSVLLLLFFASTSLFLGCSSKNGSAASGSNDPSVFAAAAGIEGVWGTRCDHPQSFAFGYYAYYLPPNLNPYAYIRASYTFSGNKVTFEIHEFDDHYCNAESAPNPVATLTGSFVPVREVREEHGYEISIFYKKCGYFCAVPDQSPNFHRQVDMIYTIDDSGRMYFGELNGPGSNSWNYNRYGLPFCRGNCDGTTGPQQAYAPPNY